MRLEFYEVLSDVLSSHDINSVQLSHLVDDKGSLVPKWLRGERIPQIPDLDLIISAINPTGSEIKGLQVARRYSALREALERPKLGLSPNAIDQQLRTLVIREYHPNTLLVPIAIEEELAHIRQMRLEGRPMQAIGAMEVLGRQVNKNFSSLRSRRNASVLADYYKESLSLTINTAVPGSVYGILQDDVSQLIELGHRLEDRELIAHAYFRAGDAHHLDLGPDTAIPLLERAMKTTEDIELRSRCLSIMLITVAKRFNFADRRRYASLRRRAEEVAGDTQGKNTIGLLWLLNEWGHSLACVGELEEAEATLDIAWSTFQKLEADGLKYRNLNLALRRATLVAASKGAFGMASSDIFSISRELIDDALQGNYPRIVLDARRAEEEVLGKH
jgi:hypothetical protein